MVLLMLIIMGIIVYGLIIKNNLDNYKSNIELSRKLLNESLKSRYELIPKIIEITKQYISYNNQDIAKLTSIVANFDGANDLAKDVFENEYNALMSKVDAIVELKTNVNYLTIVNNLSLCNGSINTARKLLKENAKNYNLIVEKSPSCYIAKLLKFETIKCDNVEEIKKI